MKKRSKPCGKEKNMKLKKLALLFCSAILLICSLAAPAHALPGDESGAPITDTQPEETVPQETQPPVTEPTDPPYSEPETQPTPSEEPEYTDPPVTSPQTQPPVSSEEETQSQKSWLDIFKLPTEPTNADETIPEKKEGQTTTTQYVIMGILLWVLIACGSLISLGVLASTHRRKRGK